METTIEKNTLLAKLEDNYADAQARVKKAYRILRKAQEIIPLMPEIIFSQEYYIFREDEDHKWYLETVVLADNEEADEFIKQLKIAGVYGIKSKYKGFADRWYYTGSFAVGDEVITIMVDGGSKPANCRIEETKEMKEVTTYKAICEDTGEEV